MADYRIRIPIEADSSKLRTEVARSKSSLDSLKGSASKFGEGLSSAGGPLGQLSSGISGLAGKFNLASVGGGIAGAAVAAFAAACTLAAREISKTEVALAKTEAILKATGNASGFTTKQLDEMSRSMAMMTLATTEGIRNAQNVLLTFKSISGPQFQKTIEIAQDMAAVFGGDASSAATMLGKALEDPVTGLSSLKEVGVSFTAEQKNLILSLQKTGQAAQAQTEILKVLEQQVGGAGKAEASGISGAVDTLNQRWGELMENFGVAIGLSPKLVTVLNAVSAALGMGSEALAADTANQLFEERLDLQMRLMALESSSAIGIQQGAKSLQIRLLQEEIAAIDEKLIKQIQIENAETAAQARAAERAQLAKQEIADAARLNELKKQRIADLDALIKKEDEYNVRRAEATNGLLGVTQQLATQTEAIDAKYTAQLTAISSAREMGLQTSIAYDELEIRAAMAREDKITEIERNAKEKREALAEAESANRQRALGGMLSNLATLMNSKSRKMFEIGKAAAIAETVISTGRAAMGAYAALAPIPVIGPALGIAAAAAAVAAGAVQVQQIKSQQFGGGGTVSAGGIGGGASPGTYVPPQPTQPYGPQDAKNEGRSVNLIFNGDINGFDIQGLAEQLGEYINTSDTIFIDSNSRTGLQFANAI